MQTKTENGQNVDMEKFLEDIRAVVKDGEDLLKAGVTTVKSRAIDKAKQTDRVVRQYPYQSLGIVFGVGLVLGLVAMGMFRGGNDEMEEED
jgi:ElaB/YqjD/DUF883 family membrane-anchored ribosome-binding protein